MATKHQTDATKDSKPTKPKTLSKSLPSDRLAFSKQMEVLRGYAAASGPERRAVTNADVARVVNLTASTVSMNNAFLQDNAFVERGAGGITPASEVFEFHQAFEWNVETAAHKLAPIFRRAWFFKALEQKLRFRDVRLSEAIQDLAHVASAGTEYRDRIAVLIEYLDAAGLVRKDGDVVALGPTARNGATPEIPPQADPEAKPAERARVSTSSHVSMPSSTEGAVRFNVSIHVNMTELSGWEPARIAAFFQGIAKVLAAKSGVEEESVS